MVTMMTNNRPLPLLVLVLAAACFNGIHAKGIDFDLNEPPPADLDAELELDELELPPAAAAAPPISCPRPRSLQERIKKAAAVSSVVAGPSGSAGQLKELPDYCDYEKFKSSMAAAKGGGGGADGEQPSAATSKPADPSESLFRRSMYLKRCLDVFRSRIDYRLGKKTYLESVTPLSDRSPNEIRQMFMSAPAIEFALNQAQARQHYGELVRARSQMARENEALEVASQASAFGPGAGHEDQLKPDEIESFASDPSLVLNSFSAKAMLSAMVKSARADQDDEYRRALREELLGAQLETVSQACASAGPNGKSPYPTDRWPLTSRRPAGLSASSRTPAQLAAIPYVRPDLMALERDYLDWSQHKCFHRIYKQFDKCGCCYMVAATSLAEFVKCTERPDTIEPRKFSQVYVLNCGLKYSPDNLGCAGGSVLETLRFIGHSGVYSVAEWRKEVEQSVRSAARTAPLLDVRDLNCPVSLDRPRERWGLTRIELNPVLVHANEWIEALQDGPLVANVQLPKEGMVTYAGGVHDGATCQGSNLWHVMVLVGYGIDEHGIAYWRFRNSFGPKWGDQGHFNLAMSVPGDCLAGGVRVYREPVSLPWSYMTPPAAGR